MASPVRLVSFLCVITILFCTAPILFVDAFEVSNDDVVAANADVDAGAAFKRNFLFLPPFSGVSSCPSRNNPCQNGARCRLFYSKSAPPPFAIPAAPSFFGAFWRLFPFRRATSTSPNRPQGWLPPLPPLPHPGPYFVCDCPPEFHGRKCEKRKDNVNVNVNVKTSSLAGNERVTTASICSLKPCKNDGWCQEGRDGYLCRCKPG